MGFIRRSAAAGIAGQSVVRDETAAALDEPVTGLDPVITSELYSLVKRLNQEAKSTVIMVSHDIASAINYADKILHMGGKHFFGTTQDYMATELYGQRRNQGMAEFLRIFFLYYFFKPRTFSRNLGLLCCAALVGVSLVLKRYSMIGDTIFLVHCRLLCNELGTLPVSIPVVMAAAFLLLRLVNGQELKAMPQSRSLAIGVIVTSLTCRYERRCVQLYVWQYFSCQPKRCVDQRDFIRDCADPCYLVFFTIRFLQ